MSWVVAGIAGSIAVLIAVTRRPPVPACPTCDTLITGPGGCSYCSRRPTPTQGDPR